ncbi:hypothetical protein C8Q80DRAFT_1174275 [Daedaleopsis nitida]|nr:hypothetical protein C8Q80DRAFT_1174275 [Daedaleopsis nitida]
MDHTASPVSRELTARRRLARPTVSHAIPSYRTHTTNRMPCRIPIVWNPVYGEVPRSR